MTTVELRTSEVQKGIAEWEKKLKRDVYLGPSACYPIHKICYSAYTRGLLPEGDKFGFVREVAEIMYFVQPDDNNPRLHREELNLEQISKEIGRNLSRVEVVVEMMTNANFIPYRKTAPYT